MSVCYGYGNNFRLNIQNPHNLVLVLVTKQRREFIKDRVELQSSPENICFHIQVNDPLYTAFESVLRKIITFQVHRVQVHVAVIDHYSPMHEILMRQFNVPFYY